MTVNTSKLPLGITDFPDFKKRGLIYVDKTRMIYQLTQSNAPILLTRPRRFGKSLLVSTFNALFSLGLEDFKGLEIEKLWKEEKTYPVVHLNCSGVSGRNYEEIIRSFNVKLERAAKMAGFIPDKSSTWPLLEQFSDWLAALNKKGESIVLLIDEYDAPLTKLLNNKTLFDDVRNYFPSLTDKFLF